MKINLLDRRVSFGTNIKRPKQLQTRRVGDILDAIRDGEWRLDDQLANIPGDDAIRAVSQKIAGKFRMLADSRKMLKVHFANREYEKMTFGEKRALYDFRLADQSLLLFKKGGSDIHDGWLSYTYTEPPVSVFTYDEFVLSQFPQEDSTPSEILGLWGDSLRSDYETQIGTANLKEGVTPIRYDYKASDYRRAVHPASHMHFGFDNEIRVAVPHVLTPLAFTLFILRQRYPHQWSTLVQCDTRNAVCKNLRESLDPVSDEYWGGEDKWEMFLT